MITTRLRAAALGLLLVASPAEAQQTLAERLYRVEEDGFRTAEDLSTLTDGAYFARRWVDQKIEHRNACVLARNLVHEVADGIRTGSIHADGPIWRALGLTNRLLRRTCVDWTDEEFLRIGKPFRDFARQYDDR